MPIRSVGYLRTSFDRAPGDVQVDITVNLKSYRLHLEVFPLLRALTVGTLIYL